MGIHFNIVIQLRPDVDGSSILDPILKDLIPYFMSNKLNFANFS